MAYKVIVTDISTIGIGAPGATFDVAYIDLSTNLCSLTYNDAFYFGTDITTYTPSDIILSIQGKLIAFAASNGITVTANDIVWNEPSPLSYPEAVAIKAATLPKSFTNNASHSIQTVAAAANGFQLSATRDAQVSYAATIVTAATLLAGAVGSVVLEIAATNSSSAGAWQEIGRITNGQVFSLAVAIGCTQTISGSISGIIPAGYYARLRSINTTGTPSYSYNSGQEVLL